MLWLLELSSPQDTVCEKIQHFKFNSYIGFYGTSQLWGKNQPTTIKKIQKYVVTLKFLLLFIFLSNRSSKFIF